jgi:hypothetical protein
MRPGRVSVRTVIMILLSSSSRRKGRRRIPLTRSKCDFCTDDKLAQWSYKAGEFLVEDVAIKFKNEWLACDECSRLIDEEDLRGLMERALTTFEKAFPERVPDEFVRSKLRNLIYQTHLEFFKKRTQWRKDPVP